MKLPFILAGLTVALTLGLGSRSEAAIFTSFGPEFLFDTNNSDNAPAPGGDLGFAYRFNAGAGSGGLPHIEVKAPLFSPTGVMSTIHLGIYSAAEFGNFPGALLGEASFEITQTFSTDPNDLFTGTISDLALASGTDYFVGFIHQAGADATWHWADAGAPNAFGVVAFFADSEWANLETDGRIGAFSITPVPEPREYAFAAAIALLGFAACRRWSSRRAGQPS